MIHLLQRTTPSHADASMGFTCLCRYDTTERPMYLYQVAKVGEDGQAAVIDFWLDLNGWIATASSDVTDTMVKLVTFKSNNTNTIALYVDGDCFRIEVRPTDGSATQYYWHTPLAIDGLHHLTVTATHTKDRTGNVRLYYYGEHLHVFKKVGTLMPTSNYTADYWMLGLDLRRSKPQGVAHRWARFFNVECQP